MANKSIETKRIVALAIAEVKFNASENNRDPIKDYDTIPSLMNDIRENGQKQPTIMRKMPDGYHPLQGFRRTLAIMKLHDLYPNGYEYVVGDKTEVRKFDKVLAEVVEVDDDEAFTIMSDHGNVEPLSQVGLHITTMRAFERGKPEKWIVNNLRNVFDIRHPIPAAKLKELNDKVNVKLADIKPDSPRFNVTKVAAEEDVYFLYRRGLIQQVNRVYQSPIVVQDAYLAKMRGEQAWPSDKEVAELLVLYESERKENPLTITKQKPGPKFLEAWSKLSEAKIEAESNGTRPKAASMMPKSEVENLQKNLNSVSGKLFSGIILRTIDQSVAKDLDDVCVQAESEMSPELKGRLLKLVERAKLAPTPPAEQPKA